MTSSKHFIHINGLSKTFHTIKVLCHGIGTHTKKSTSKNYFTAQKSNFAGEIANFTRQNKYPKHNNKVPNVKV